MTEQTGPLMDEKPWDKADSPASLSNPIGMLGDEERRCYYWLGRNRTSGQGCIVDAGAFLGASTFCFAAGASDAGHLTFNGSTMVHAYDYFKVVDVYVGEAISRDFRPISDGESYLDIFQSQTAAYGHMITPYPGDFLEHTWNGDAIEVLFIDIAKTSELCAHAVGQFFPCLIPGRSVVVHQDYNHCWHPYIHIGMEFLTDEFMLDDELVINQSRVWHLTKPLPADKIARVANYDFTKEERLMLLERLAVKSSDMFRPMIRVVQAWQHCMDRDFDLATSVLGGIRPADGFESETALWAVQALQVQSYIAERS